MLELDKYDSLLVRECKARRTYLWKLRKIWRMRCAIPKECYNSECDIYMILHLVEIAEVFSDFDLKKFLLKAQPIKGNYYVYPGEKYEEELGKYWAGILGATRMQIRFIEFYKLPGFCQAACWKRKASIKY